LWLPSYFAASCGGAPIAQIRQYIEQAENPTLKHAFGVRAILPRPEGRGLPRILINPTSTCHTIDIL